MCTPRWNSVRRISKSSRALGRVRAGGCGEIRRCERTQGVHSEALLKPDPSPTRRSPPVKPALREGQKRHVSNGQSRHSAVLCLEISHPGGIFLPHRRRRGSSRSHSSPPPGSCNAALSLFRSVRFTSGGRPRPGAAENGPDSIALA